MLQSALGAEKGLRTYFVQSPEKQKGKKNPNTYFDFSIIQIPLSIVYK